MNSPNPHPSPAIAHAVILFDGLCNFCDRSIHFVIDRDPLGRFVFVSLQSETARRLLEPFRLDPSTIQSVVLIEDQRAYLRSEAAIRIAKRLGGIWPMLSPLLWIPRPIRDAVYDLIARNRYRWWGKRESCRLPTPEMRARFLE